MHFELFVYEEAGNLLVFQELPEPIREGLGEAVKVHRFELKQPMTHALRMQADQLARTGDALLGFTLDESRRQGAFCEAFLESWTLDKPLTVDGFNSLHPNLAEAVFSTLFARVYPGVASCPDFMKALQTRPGP